MNDNITESSLQSGTVQSLSSFAVIPSACNTNQSDAKHPIQVIDDFNDQPSEPLIPPNQRELKVETYFSNQNLDQSKSMNSKRSIMQTYQSAGTTSQAQQKNFTFNETTSSQPKQLLSTQRSNILELANRQSPINISQQTTGKTNMPNPFFQTNSRTNNDYTPQYSSHQSLMGAQILSQEGGQRANTLLQRFQQQKPSIKSQLDQQFAQQQQQLSHQQQAPHSLSVSSAKSGAQGISQSLMYLNKNREKLQQTHSQEQLAKYYQKSPQMQQQIDNQSNYGYYQGPIQPFSTISHPQMQTRTPTNIVHKVIDQRVARSSSGNRGGGISSSRLQELQTLANPSAFQQQRHSHVDHTNYNSSTPFFFNIRNFKRHQAPSTTHKRMNLIVPITSTSLVDDYNTNYSTILNKRIAAQGLSTGHKQSRNQQFLQYSPATQPLFSSHKKSSFRGATPLVPTTMQMSQQSLSMQTLKSDIESVKQEVLLRKQDQLQREMILNQLDQEMLSSQQVEANKVVQQLETSELDSEEDSSNLENSRFQSSSDNEAKRIKRQQQRQRYRQAHERRPYQQVSQQKTQGIESYNEGEEEEGIILITADNEEVAQQQPQGVVVGNRAPHIRIHPQYINTDSSNYYTSESQQTALHHDPLDTHGSLQQQVQKQGKQVRLRRQVGQFRAQKNQKYNMNQVHEISMSGYSSSKNHSISNASSIRFDNRPKVRIYVVERYVGFDSLILLQRREMLLVSLFTITQQQNTTQISCPVLTCDSVLDHNVCYQHDGLQPVRQLKAYSCETYQLLEEDIKGQVICDFNLQANTFAWVNETYQNLTNSTDTSTSQLYRKKTQGNCRGVEAFTQQLLNNGRSCSRSSECQSKSCINGQCTGYSQNEFCSAHADCQQENYCSINSETSKCVKEKTSYETCNETYECAIELYCWYANVDDRRTTMRKQCLPLYSQDDGTSFGWYSTNWKRPTYNDYELNGRYCKSGIAFPVSEFEANCTSVNTVVFNNKTIDSPYKCDPTNNAVQCQLWFNTSSNYVAKNGTLGYDYVEVPCACALDGDSGYCQKILGTPEYADGKSSLKALLEQSFCHTLDRNNMRAHKDICGIPGDDPGWIEAVQKNFRLTYWPYVQVSRVSDCINMFFSDSYTNILKSSAAHLSIALFLIPIYYII